MWSAWLNWASRRAAGPSRRTSAPTAPVTRAQAASFLVLAFELAPSGPFGFTDTGGNVHKAAINSLAAARITNGCDAWPLRFCPRDPVRPSQMASFLARGLDLVPRPEAVASRYDGWVDPESSGKPWGDAVQGLLTFRGNPTRSYYGRGPVPEDPRVVWRFPDTGPMCSNSPVGGRPRIWCGSGWTGQPSVFERDGSTWLVVGAFSRNVHFLDADTGKRLLPDFRTGDIIKGSVTIDPDGYPARLHRQPRQQIPDHCLRRGRAPGAVGSGRVRGGTDPVERRLGQRGHGHR